ncbi:MAG TPA: hypothetical protein ENI27_04350 [bacterium]|nr:hypothetical protein [bacterium]
MGYDIYGGVLRRGYCEVHPDNNQEYPCDICMGEDQHPEQPYPEQTIEEYCEGSEGHSFYMKDQHGTPHCHCGKRTEFTEEELGTAE